MTLGLASSACSGKCAAGRHGSAEAQTSDQCSGPCLDGFWCPAGSTSPTAEPCGSNAVYCASPWTAPIPVQTGWYSTGNTAATVSGLPLHAVHVGLLHPWLAPGLTALTASTRWHFCCSARARRRARRATHARTGFARRAPRGGTATWRASATHSAPARATLASCARLARQLPTPTTQTLARWCPSAGRPASTAPVARPRRASLAPGTSVHPTTLPAHGGRARPSVCQGALPAREPW